LDFYYSGLKELKLDFDEHLVPPVSMVLVPSALTSICVVLPVTSALMVPFPLSYNLFATNCAKEVISAAVPLDTKTVYSWDTDKGGMSQKTEFSAYGCHFRSVSHYIDTVFV
jgi:hypothetical protein